MDEPIVNHNNEEDRIQALRSLHVLDTPIEERFERITRLARNAFNVPICAISCVDQTRVWFKSSQGIDHTQVSRGGSFCQHTILQHKVMIVEDARIDKRYSNFSCVQSDMNFVFYAGAPIYSPCGQPIAAFCLVGTEPREFSLQDTEMLNDFARLAERELAASSINEIEHNLITHVDESWRQMLIDPMTRLWNHEGIMMVAGEALSNSFESHTGMCMTMLDIRRFHEINSALGQSGGDELLKAFSSALLHEVRKDDALGRIHGNQFLIIMNSISDQARIEAATARFRRFIDSYQINGVQGYTQLEAAIVAISIPPKWTGDLETLFEELDDAMFQAKRASGTEPIITQAHCELGTDDMAA